MKKTTLLPRIFFALCSLLIFCVTTARAVTWTVAGAPTSILKSGATWAPATSDNDLSQIGTSEWWVLHLTNKVLGANTDGQFKICKDHAWATAYPTTNKSMYVTNAGTYNIIYTFNSNTHDVYGDVYNTWCVAGSSGILGSNWDETDVLNKMTKVGEWGYTLTKSNISLTAGETYEFKIVSDAGWTYSYPGSNKTFSVTESGTYNLVFKFNIITKEVTVQALRTIYFINSSNWTGTIQCYAWNTGNSLKNAAWPGEAMTNTGLTDDCGHAIWSYQLDAASYNRVIFTNKTSGSNQTEDLTPVLAKPYYHNNNKDWFTTPPAECSDVYFVNTEEWENVYCYAWSGSSNNGAYPGIAMTNTGTTLCGYPVYKYHLSGSFANCIFSAGSGKPKTRNLTVTPDGYFNYEMQQWYADEAAVTAACVSSTGTPVMTYGKAEAIYARKAEIQVGAIDDNTPFDEMVYYCELETPMGETYRFYQITFFENIHGYFDIINLIPCSDYTLTIRAIDNDGNLSTNDEVISFKTTCDDGDGLYLSGTFNSWNAANEDWQFQFHNADHDRYILIKDNIPAGAKYKLTKSGTWDPVCNIYSAEGADVAVFTAKAVDKHISSLDEVYIVGPAVNDGSVWNLTNARKMTWENAISARWEGAMTKGQKYRIVVRHHYMCDDNSTGTYDEWDYITDYDLTFDKDYSNAVLTFDLLTWSWDWENADDNLCEKVGAPPAGVLPPDYPGASAFQMGYEVSIYTPTATQLVVTAKSNDWKKRTGSVAPVFQLFAEESMTGIILEKTMVEDGRQDANGNKYYTLTINRGDKAENYPTKDLVADFTMGACIRWSVKFPYAGKFSVTDPMYYYIRQGCAPYYFEIYHHDDAPDASALTSFAGGHIPQPIIYRRKFHPGAWETLILPFECSAVRVYDPDDDKEYDLGPQHADESAGYWLRTFGEAVDRDGFKPNWSNVPTGVERPQKDVPYIMMMPDVGGYYDDKYVMFYGKGYQTVADKTSWTKSGSANGFRYFGNTTMWPQNLGQAYMISYDGLWFEKSGGNTLYPFECYVVADPTTTARYVRMGATNDQSAEIATGLPSTADDHSLACRYDGALLYLEATADTPVAIYTVDGTLITKAALTANTEAAFALTPGIYIVSTEIGFYKLAL
ncbi:MAG: starch-binding protein [Paludibacteraceae bacterium]|nr:starch-binding protein [Paludibacteraceae bacterium]